MKNVLKNILIITFVILMMFTTLVVSKEVYAAMPIKEEWESTAIPYSKNSPSIKDPKVGDIVTVQLTIISKYVGNFYVTPEDDPNYDVISKKAELQWHSVNGIPPNGNKVSIKLKLKKVANSYKFKFTTLVKQYPYESNSPDLDLNATPFEYKTKLDTINIAVTKTPTPKPVAKPTTQPVAVKPQQTQTSQTKQTIDPKKVDPKQNEILEIKEDITTGDVDDLNQEIVKVRDGRLPLYIVIGVLSTIIVAGGATGGYFIYKAKKPKVNVEE